MTVLRVPAFRNFLVGSTISQLGDVCFAVALPWLVLGMTSSTAGLGSVLIALAIPRAGLMLLGGAVSDRVSAKTVLIIGNLTLTLCVATIALLAWYHLLALWMLYPLAIVFGIADAFGQPATKVLLPALVPRDEITAANSVLQSAVQVCLLAGGAVAGILIQRFGIVPALAIDACSFVFLIAAVATIRMPNDVRLHTTSLLDSISEGIRYVVTDPSTRTLLVAIAAVNLCVPGATQIGLVALIHARFGSAAYYGGLVTAVAVGSLLGIILAAAIKSRGSAAANVLAAGAALGLGLATLALPLPIAAIFAVVLLCGLISGYINVNVVSSLQKSVAPDMLGRVMSIVTLSSVAVAPISLALSGLVAQRSLALLFVVAGGSLVGVALAGWLFTSKSKGP